MKVGSKTAPPVLDEHGAVFITHSVSILAASCNGLHESSIGRALGSRVSEDRRTVTLFVPVRRAEQFLKHVRAGGPIAVVITKPSTHESLQLKGGAAELVSLKPGDRDLMKQYARSFMADIAKMGYRDPFNSALVSTASEDAVGVRFEPSAAFVSTPGAQAGKKLDAKP